ncbi:MAG TPA: ribosome biogenesis GTPase YlqF [Candidatus Avacidaminococcus intestinavium]|uniref:Ribosome biogenesis GTPase A n=1 Tax=Candidatus Avacidaminococcus intestinavium TaxID=2840684 RepID=A0A9D1MNG5_9FIRM|nr:ribosome biogenesis GTPase YlqF [Candidatus Avacidaminococcus intestinavium]
MMEFKIQWFPGHMTKARRMMEEQLKLVDIVIEILDARIPRSSTNPMLNELLGNKIKIIALNKIDLADNEQTDLWLETFKRNSLTCVKIDCATGRGVKQMIAAVQLAAKPVTEKWLKKGVKNRPIRVMIVGIPNVGKSTLINRIVGKNKVFAANRPGVTRGQQWITIAKGLELLDTPGVLWPKFENEHIGFSLAITGAVKDDVFDNEAAVLLLLNFLREKYPQALIDKYRIQIEVTDFTETLLEKIAIARGCVRAGGRPDLDKAIKLVLRDFRTGGLGRFTLDSPDRN